MYLRIWRRRRRPPALYLRGSPARKICGFVRFLGNLVTEQASNILAGDEALAGQQQVGPTTIPFEDAGLVARCRKGDMQAFGVLVTKYHTRVFNMIFRMCGRRADAEELAQEVFLKALENLDQFRGRSKFYTWLFRIAANLTISHRRRGGRVRFQSLTRDDDYDGAQAESLTAELAERRTANPEKDAMTAETADMVTAAPDELDDEFRLVVVLRDIEGMDYSRIGQVLELPVGTVKSRLHRARCLLRSKLSGLIDG